MPVGVVMATRWRREMALQPSTLAAGHPRGTVLLGVLVVLAVVIAAMLVATAVFGLRPYEMLYTITPDPAGGTLPF